VFWELELAVLSFDIVNVLTVPRDLDVHHNPRDRQKMDVEAEAVYVDILRSLQSSILNSASVSLVRNNELTVQCFDSY
jgi:hypothetical protein